MDIQREKKTSKRRYVWIGVAIGVVILVTFGISRLEPAAPTVDAGTLWRDTVEQGTMLREVRGPGTLVPENIRWISAVTAGRVERIDVEPGVTVKPETSLLELSNPDVQLALLDAQRQLTGAESELVNLRSSLESQRLTQEGTVAQIRTQQRDAERQAKTMASLSDQDLAAANEVANARDRAEELKTRLDVEQKRLEVLTRQLDAQLKVQEAQVARLRSIVAFRQQQLESMKVKANTEGVLQDLPLQAGQWVTPGTVLARVIQPGRLKAVLRIPETQAKDVALGQLARIDTRNGIVEGHVSRMDPAAQNGTVTVDVRLTGDLPAGARPDLSVDGTIEVERLTDVLYVGRPAYGQPESTVGLFKLVDGGNAAVRVPVQLGRSSVNTIEIVSGLSKGDVVILSDMSAWDGVDRVRLK